MKEFYDVIILGGGPAGSAAALTLMKMAPEWSVALIESSRYELWRVGETLSPDAGRSFREMGIWDSFLKSGQLSTQGTSAAWESDVIHENEFLHHPEGKGWHLDRVRFDQWMAQEAQNKGAELLVASKYVNHQVSDGTFRIALSRDGNRFEIETRFVIDALGRTSPFGKNEGVQRKVHDRLSGCVSFFPANSDFSSLGSYTLVEAVENGWWYSAHLSEQRFVVAYMSDADLIKEERLHEPKCFADLLGQTLYTCRRVKWKQPESVRVLSAASILNQKVTGEGWLAVGDAASTFDPLSSQGIYKAIRSGMFGAYAAFDVLNGKNEAENKYQRFISEEYEEYIKTRGRFYNQVKRWPNAEFWKRRHVDISLTGTTNIS